MPTLSTNADNLSFTAPNQQWIIQTGVVVGSTERPLRRLDALRWR